MLMKITDRREAEATGCWLEGAVDVEPASYQYRQWDWSTLFQYWCWTCGQSLLWIVLSGPWSCLSLSYGIHICVHFSVNSFVTSEKHWNENHDDYLNSRWFSVCFQALLSGFFPGHINLLLLFFEAFSSNCFYIGHLRILFFLKTKSARFIKFASPTCTNGSANYFNGTKNSLRALLLKPLKNLSSL